MAPRYQFDDVKRVAATLFDGGNRTSRRWSKQQFGDRWDITRIGGTVIARAGSPGKTLWEIRFHDDSAEHDVAPKDLKLFSRDTRAFKRRRNESPNNGIAEEDGEQGDDGNGNDSDNSEGGSLGLHRPAPRGGARQGGGNSLRDGARNRGGARKKNHHCSNAHRGEPEEFTESEDEESESESEDEVRSQSTAVVFQADHDKREVKWVNGGRSVDPRVDAGCAKTVEARFTPPPLDHEYVQGREILQYFFAFFPYPHAAAMARLIMAEKGQGQECPSFQVTPSEVLQILDTNNMILFGNCDRVYGSFSSVRAECAPRNGVGAFGPRRNRETSCGCWLVRPWPRWKRSHKLATFQNKYDMFAVIYPKSTPDWAHPTRWAAFSPLLQ